MIEGLKKFFKKLGKKVKNGLETVYNTILGRKKLSIKDVEHEEEELVYDSSTGEIRSIDTYGEPSKLELEYLKNKTISLADILLDKRINSRITMANVSRHDSFYLEVNVSFDTEYDKKEYRIDFTISDVILDLETLINSNNISECIIETAKEALLAQYSDLAPLLESIDSKSLNMEIISKAPKQYTYTAEVTLVIAEKRLTKRTRYKTRSYSTSFSYDECLEEGV